MNVWKIPEALYDQYRGTGYGLAAVVNNEIVGFKYINDIADEFYIDKDSLEADGVSVDDRLKEIIEDERMGPTIRYLQALGEVSMGIFSCYEFCEL